MSTFSHKSFIHAAATEVREWLARPGAVDRLVPPWLHNSADLPFSPENNLSVTVEDERDGSVITDHVAIPDSGRTERLVRDLERICTFRHQRLQDDLARHRAAATPPLRVAISGASGLIGSHLSPFLRAGGHTVVPLVRRRAGVGEISWDPDAGKLDPADLSRVDAVIHLAGESIAGVWTAAKKKRIRDSRIVGTKLLATTLAQIDPAPRVLVSASGIGFYGDTKDEIVDETHPGGSGFLAELAEEWEAATRPAGIRVVNLRIGLVLSARGAMLGSMLRPFRMGLGARFGDGRQWMSWIAIDDLLGAFLHALATPALFGPTNAVSDRPVRQLDFTRTLAKVLDRPAVLSIPAFALRALVPGGMADEALLASCRAHPKRLEETGFRLLYADLESALRLELGAR